MYLNADGIIAMINERKEKFFDAQIAGTASDPKVYSHADAMRAIADEYDDLLAEISKKRSGGFQTKVKG